MLRSRRSFPAPAARRAALAGALGLGLAAGDPDCAERMRDGVAVAESPRIAYGSASSLWPAVGAVLDVQAGSVSECTGVLISPSWVLTAGHCLSADPTAADYRFVVASDYAPYFASGGTTASSLIVDPDYDTGTEAHDLGLIELAAPLTSVTPFVLDDEAAPPPGTTFDVLGYGITQNNANNTLKMLGTSIVGADAGLTADQVYFTPDPAIPCEGDSGAPFFLQAANGLPVVFVTVAFGSATCNASSYTVGIRTAAALGFITGHATDACLLSGSPLANCDYIFRNGLDPRLSNP